MIVTSSKGSRVNSSFPSFSFKCTWPSSLWRGPASNHPMTPAGGRGLPWIGWFFASFHQGIDVTCFDLLGYAGIVVMVGGWIRVLDQFDGENKSDVNINALLRLSLWSVQSLALLSPISHPGLDVHGVPRRGDSGCVKAEEDSICQIFSQLRTIQEERCRFQNRPTDISTMIAVVRYSVVWCGVLYVLRSVDYRVWSEAVRGCSSSSLSRFLFLVFFSPIPIPILSLFTSTVYIPFALLLFLLSFNLGVFYNCLCLAGHPATAWCTRWRTRSPSPSVVTADAVRCNLLSLLRSTRFAGTP